MLHETTTCSQTVDFKTTTCSQTVDFKTTTCSQTVDFKTTTCSQTVDFKTTTCSQTVDFKTTTCSQTVDFKMWESVCLTAQHYNRIVWYKYSLYWIPIYPVVRLSINISGCTSVTDLCGCYSKFISREQPLIPGTLSAQTNSTIFVFSINYSVFTSTAWMVNDFLLCYPY